MLPLNYYNIWALSMINLNCCGVYKIVCSITNKCYVGSSKNIRVRWVEHQRHLNRNTHPNPKLQRAWNKYGADNFQLKVIYRCDEATAIRLEDKHIKRLKAYTDGYNCMSYATMWNSPEVKKRVSEVTKANHAAGLYLEHNRKNIASGVCHNSVQRKKASEHLKQLHAEGRVHTPRMKALASARMKQVVAEGKFHLNTPERMAKSLKRLKAMNKSGKMNSTEQRQRASERMKRLNADKEFQKKALASRKAKCGY